MEKQILSKAHVHSCILLTIALFAHSAAEAQSCPTSSTQTLNAYPNTYYPGTANAGAGTTSITLGNAIGATPIAVSDILLVIQMQGAQITSGNTSSYGDGGGSGTGYLNNANLSAGKMEYVVAASAVALTGGTRVLTIQSPLVNSYKNAPYIAGTSGQYTFQVIRVPVYYNVTLGATIKPPAWNGATGGVVVLYVTQTLNMNGHTIDASGAGFRGGGGKQFSNGGGSGVYTDYIAMSTANANGAKGEGIAGTPRYINNNWASPAFDNGVEGYPFGSMNMGAPGNAGGGATDGNPIVNNNNAGGGGGGNGAAGGVGGNGWNTPTKVTGGKPGAKFSQVSPSRLVMGGGGGAGSTDGGTGSYGTGNGVSSSGMPGGGIVLVAASMVTGTGTIDVSGLYTNSNVLNDGSGGGGAGGSVVITAANGTGLPGVTVHADGSAGGSNTGGGSAAHGPGGGGGGGVIYSNQPLNAASTAAGGVNGTTFGGIAYSSQPGVTGIQNQGILLSQQPQFPIACIVLATEFVSVSAIDQNGNIIVNWQVANEENVNEYVVERSFDGSNFTRAGVIGYKPVAGGVHDYNFTDPGTGNNHPLCYYRIKREDADGQSAFSKIVLVKLPVYTKLMVTPNPVAESATLSFMSDHNADVSIRLIDLNGNSVWRKQYLAGTGMNTLQLEHLQDLPDGIYILQLYDGLNYEKVKMSIRH
jgi:hypothetical protein